MALIAALAIDYVIKIIILRRGDFESRPKRTSIDSTISLNPIGVKTAQSVI